MDDFNLAGKFRVLSQSNIRWLALEPSGANLTSYKGETLVLEFDSNTSEDELNQIASTLNERLRRAVIKDLSGA
ncbi:hypothetical protein GOC40_01525 [Sinorhizobium meliloti]|nr:hypothetical protein [Sinorhizobium meliloti]